MVDDAFTTREGALTLHRQAPKLPRPARFDGHAATPIFFPLPFSAMPAPTHLLRFTHSEPLERSDADVELMLDLPRVTAHAASRRITVSGWSYAPLTGLRICALVAGDTVCETRCCISRPRVPDVVADPAAVACGFSLDVVLPEADATLELHALDDDGRIRARERLHFTSCAPRKRLFFIHIPKTAGSTVNRFMEELLGPDACALHVPLAKYPNGLGEFDDRAYLAGHFPITEVLRRTTHEETLLASLVRDPFEQLLSHIAWTRRMIEPEERHRLLSLPEPLQQLAADLGATDLSSAAAIADWTAQASRAARLLYDNCQVRYLANGWRPIEKVEPTHTHSAIDNLEKLDALGLNDAVPDFLATLATTIGVESARPIATPHENAADTKYGLESCREELREVLRPWFRHDELLYAAAREHIEAART
jgi:hypothetical protein